MVEKKTVKVHIRPVHVRDGKEFVRLGKAANPQKLLDEMNAIWKPQTTENIASLRLKRMTTHQEQ